MKGTGFGSHHQKQVEVLIGRTKESLPSIKLLYIIEEVLLIAALSYTEHVNHVAPAEGSGRSDSTAILNPMKVMTNGRDIVLLLPQGVSVWKSVKSLGGKGRGNVWNTTQVSRTSQKVVESF